MKRFSLAFAFALAVLVSTSMWAQTSWTFQTVNYPNDTFTQLLGINNNLVIAGYHNFNTNSGFTHLLSSPLFTTENYPNSMMTQVIGINNSNTTSGFYVDNNNNTHGFYDKNGTFTTVDFPGTIFNQLLSQNDLSQAAGYYSQSQNNSTPDTPYIYDENGGVFQVINIPGAVGGAQATGINNLQQVCGFWVDGAGTNHGFFLNAGSFTSLDFPNSIFTQALGLNNKGQLVGQWQDAGANTHGFVWTAMTGFQAVDDPHGIGMTVINGINDKGYLVGFYGTNPINSGFVAIPR
jgi:hypothetical protein